MRRFRSLAITALAIGTASLAQAPRGARDVLDEIRARGRATLHDCYRLALLASESLEAARERTRQTEARYRIGIGALLPSITAQGTQYAQDAVPLSGSGETFFATEDRRREARLRLDQAVTRFGAERAGLGELKRRVEAEEAIEHDEERRLYRAVAEAYAGVLFREREEQVREDQVGSGRERLREMEARHEVGLARRAELLAIRTQLSADEAALEEARSGLFIAREDLALAIGLPVDLPLEEPLSEAESEPPALSAEAIEAAVEDRPDVRAARLSAEADRLHVGLVRGSFLPRLDLSGNYYLDRQGYSAFQEETDWDATLTLAIPIFDGGIGRARLAEARALAEEGNLALSLARRRARRDIRAAEVLLSSTGARLRTLRDGLEHAEESAALAAEEYRHGISTNLEVESARVALGQARLLVERQKLDLMLARIDLDLALGKFHVGGEAPALPSMEGKP